MQQRSPWEPRRPSRRFAYWFIVFSAALAVTFASLVVVAIIINGPWHAILLYASQSVLWLAQIFVWSKIYKKRRYDEDDPTRTNQTEQCEQD